MINITSPGPAFRSDTAAFGAPAGTPLRALPLTLRALGCRAAVERGSTDEGNGEYRSSVFCYTCAGITHKGGLFQSAHLRVVDH